MKTPALHKRLLGANFTVRYALTARLAKETTLTESPQRYVVLCALAGRLAWRTHAIGGTLESGQTLLLQTGESVTLASPRVVSPNKSDAQRVETLVLSLEPSLLLDAALAHNFVNREAEIKLRASVALGDNRIRRFASDLRDELTDERRGRDSFVAALVEQLTIHLLREHAIFRQSSALELSRVGLVDRRIRRAIELMHAHKERDLPLDELAAAAYLSPFHFARLFKKLTGTTPHAYLAAVRIAEAERLLAATDSSVTEISQQVGYASSSHFAKAFRNATGLSPRAFRAAVVRK